MLHKPFSILKPQLYISSISWAFSSWEYSKRKFPTWIINHKFKYRVVSLSIIILLSGPIEQKISMLGLLALQGFVGFCKGDASTVYPNGSSRSIPYNNGKYILYILAAQSNFFFIV